MRSHPNLGPPLAHPSQAGEKAARAVSFAEKNRDLWCCAARRTSPRLVPASLEARFPPPRVLSRCRSVVKQKLPRIEQCPEQVLWLRLTARPFRENGTRRDQLRGGRRPIDSQQVEPSRKCSVGEPRILEHAHQSAVGLKEFTIQQLAIHQIEGLAQVGVARPFALAGDRPQRPAKRVEEERRIGRIRYRDRTRAGGQLGKLLDGPRRRVDRVEQLLGR